MNRLKKNDEVVVIAGRSKGQKGKVTTFLSNGSYAIVDGVNKGKKHIKGNDNQPGSIEDQEMPIHVSNLKIIDPTNGNPTRIGFKNFNGKKQRVSKKSGEVVK